MDAKDAWTQLGVPNKVASEYFETCLQLKKKKLVKLLSDDNIDEFANIFEQQQQQCKS